MEDQVAKAKARKKPVKDAVILFARRKPRHSCRGSNHGTRRKRLGCGKSSEPEFLLIPISTNKKPPDGGFF